ncbi:MAG: DUF4395 domain-containing protein [Paludibacter sp.]|jgi:hypothetical protein|nr:DUF4395 domain-containing protein [Paludibacter sp.]
MNSNAICPISTNKIDEHIARLNATFTVLLITALILTNNILIATFLLVDFTLRGTENSKYSILSIVSKLIVNSLGLKKKPVNSGPKVFAARIGIVFSFLVVLFSILNLQTAALAFASIFGVCAFLESALGFCVACRIYPFVYKFTYRADFDRLKA